MLISVVIPCFNEESSIAESIESVLKLELPEEISTEILVVDGLSTDKTRQIIEGAMSQDDRIRLLENPSEILASALNIGFKEAQGEYILRLDAHAALPPDYLVELISTAKSVEADHIGGIIITEKGSPNYQAGIVQALTSHVFGVGNSAFRIGSKEGFVDTAAFGFYRRDVVERIGWYDERLVRAQDYEFNQRLIKSGGKIWLNPDLQAHYYGMKNLFAFYKKQLLLQGPYKAYMWYLAPYTFNFRHSITGIFSLGILAGMPLSFLNPIIKWIFLSVIVLYFLLAMFSSAQQAIRYKRPSYGFILPIFFFLYHFLHGMGILCGVFLLGIGKAPVQKKPEPWPGAGRFRAWPKT